MIEGYEQRTAVLPAAFVKAFRNKLETEVDFETPTTSTGFVRSEKKPVIQVFLETL